MLAFCSNKEFFKSPFYSAAAGEKWSGLLPWRQHGRDTWNHFPYHVPDDGECSDSRPHWAPFSQLPVAAQWSIVMNNGGKLSSLSLHRTLCFMFDWRISLFQLFWQVTRDSAHFSHAWGESRAIGVTLGYTRLTDNLAFPFFLVGNCF